MQKDSGLRSFFADLHIHIGATKSGRPVKITGSRNLTLSNILHESKYTKGMDIIGVIDCHVPEVIGEIKELIKRGLLLEQDGGGLSYDGLTLLLGSEIEINDENCNGPIHVLVYFPTLTSMERFSEYLKTRMKNIHLSSQRIYSTAKELQNYVRAEKGLFIPAHVFTPFKSLYGKGVRKTLTEVLDPKLIDAVELGLSSNTEMACCIEELLDYPFITNSDAHSLEKIAREYQLLELKEPTFEEIRMALNEKEGRRIIANYGLNPYLGKYYESVCEKCLQPTELTQSECVHCKSQKKIKGVHDRIKELQGTYTPVQQQRPPYVHQIPLEFIPGLGPKTLNKLRGFYGTDMDIIHSVPVERLRENVKPSIVDFIIQAREGNLSIQKGGGGTYGKVTIINPSKS